jgi:hypothetical protein
MTSYSRRGDTCFLTLFDGVSTHKSIGSIPVFFIVDASMDESQPIIMDHFFLHYNVGCFWMSYI